MKKYLMGLLLLTCVGVITLSSPSPLIGGKGQFNSQKPKPKYEDERWPLVDYYACEPDDPQERARRKVRDRRYNNRNIVGKPTPNTDSGEANLINDWEVGFPALPVQRSTVVLIGKITGADAHLSEDKSGIYSEFHLNIEKVLKKESAAQISPGSQMTVERMGGRVRMPTGHIHQYGVAKQGMPRVGARYVLFLEMDNEQSLYILTGYELRGGLVFPLDGVDPADGKKVPQFAEYEGVDEASFLKKLENLLAPSS